ncbi:hypothetical protein D9M69_583990 [compost metagenome]
MVFQASAQFAFQISALAASNSPKTTSPSKDKILIIVRTVCNVLLFLTPRLLIYVRIIIVIIETICAAFN